MKLLVTRPLSVSENLISELLKEGHSVLCSPVLDIQYRDRQVLDLKDVQGFIATSINGVEGLIRSTDVRDIPIYCVGDKTAEVASSKGFRDVKSADGDINTLQQLICHQVDPTSGTLLHAGGARLAGDLKNALEKEGYRYRREIFYDAMAVSDLTAEAKSALKAGELQGVLLFSPHTAKVFCKLVDDASINAQTRNLSAWCLSQNVATGLANCEFANIFISDHPSERALLELIRNTPNVTMAGNSKFKQGLREQVVSDKSNKDIPNATEKMKQSTGSSAKADAKTSVPTSEPSKSATADREKTTTSSGATGNAKTAAPLDKPSHMVRNLIVLLIVFMLGVAAWPLILPSVSKFLPEATRALVQGPVSDQSEIPVLKAQLQELQNQTPQINTERVVSIENQIEQLKSVLAESGPSGEQNNLDLDAVKDRLDALEGQLKQIETTLSDLQVRLVANGASGSTNSVQTIPVPGNLAKVSAIEETILALKEELLSLRQAQMFTQNDVQAQKSEIATLSGTVEAGIKSAAAAGVNGDEAVTLLALGQLHRESRTNNTFEGAWQQAVAAAPDTLQDALSEISSISKTGAPTLRDLSDNFESLAIEATQASRLPSSDTWYGKTLHNLASLVKFRKVGDTAGDSVDAKVATAEVKLSRGELEDAITALETLDGAAKEVISPWLAGAKNRLKVDQTISFLIDHATAKAVLKTNSQN